MLNQSSTSKDKPHIVQDMIGDIVDIIKDYDSLQIESPTVYTSVLPSEI
jgi:hypothetical protein